MEYFGPYAGRARYLMIETSVPNINTTPKKHLCLVDPVGIIKLITVSKIHNGNSLNRMGSKGIDWFHGGAITNYSSTALVFTCYVMEGYSAGSGPSL